MINNTPCAEDKVNEDYYRKLWRCYGGYFSSSPLTVHRCLNGRAHHHGYLTDYCIRVTGADTRRHLRSTNPHLLEVPRFRLNPFGHRDLGSETVSRISSGIRRSVPTAVRSILVHPAH